MSAINDDLQLKTTTYSSSAIRGPRGWGWGSADLVSLDLQGLRRIVCIAGVFKKHPGGMLKCRSVQTLSMW